MIEERREEKMRAMKGKIVRKNTNEKKQDRIQRRGIKEMEGGK